MVERNQSDITCKFWIAGACNTRSAIQIVQAARCTVAAGRQLTPAQNYLTLQNLDKAAASTTLLSYLKDTTPEIRDVGVGLIGIDPSRFVGSVRTELLTMIDDPDDSVRSHVINVLLTVNDHEALNLLIAQLKVEKALKIRVEIIHALGKLEELPALTPLLTLLHDPQPEIVIAAASAIADLAAKLRQNDPKTADDASAELHEIVDANAAVHPRNDVCAACLTALAALKDKQAFNLFMQLVQPAEPSQIRQAAYFGFQNLADTNANETVAKQAVGR